MIDRIKDQGVVRDLHEVLRLEREAGVFGAKPIPEAEDARHKHDLEREHLRQRRLDAERTLCKRVNALLEERDRLQDKVRGAQIEPGYREVCFVFRFSEREFKECRDPYMHLQVALDHARERFIQWWRTQR